MLDWAPDELRKAITSILFNGPPALLTVPEMEAAGVVSNWASMPPAGAVTTLASDQLNLPSYHCGVYGKGGVP